MRTVVVAFVLSFGVLLASSPSVIHADPVPDFDVPGGHFYTQANGSPQGARGGGFTISDANNIPFWTFFRESGGIDVLGYPVSQRFIWDGFVCQATQRAILQWNPASGQVQLANVLDYLSDLGKDDWLYSAHLAPPPQRTPYESQPLTFLTLAHYRFAWLYGDPVIFRRYFSTPNYYAIYGLPTSPIVDLGPYYAARFQRAVIYHWKSKVPWADDQGASIGLAGDLIKELGLIPAEAIRPQAGPTSDVPTTALPAVISKTVPTMATTATAPPPLAPRPAAAPDPPSPVLAAPAGPAVIGPAVVGVSTWYGRDFQGQRMSNGYPYDMWNPRIAAANIYPLGTWVRVTRLTTGKSIIVQVTDRGAFTYPNVADLSYAAFALLADPSTGVIGVRIEPVSGPG